jgi:hypothetical protein
MTAGDTRLVREAIATYFGGPLVTSDEGGIAYQGGPLVTAGLGTVLPYAQKGYPDTYFTEGMPDGAGWGTVAGVAVMERETTRSAWGGPVSGWRKRNYTVTLDLAVLAETERMEVPAAGLDDLLDGMEALIYADRTLGTTNAVLYPETGRLITQAGEDPYGIRSKAEPFELIVGKRGRSAGSATFSFVALTMVQA